MTLRFLLRLALIVVVALCTARADAQQKPTAANFETLRQSLWPEASARGISRKTFDLAFAGVTPDQRVIATTMRQPEYNSPVGTYIARIASPARIEGAARKATEWKTKLDS